MPTFNVNPLLGDDNGDGSFANPWKTWAKLNDETVGKRYSSSVVLNALADAPDTDPLYIDFDADNVTLTGPGTILTTTPAITSSILRDPATNKTNDVTISGFDFSPYVKAYARLQGSVSDAAIITKDFGGGVARFGTRVPPNLGGFAGGQVLEIVGRVKVPGIIVRGNVLSLHARFISFDSATKQVVIITPQGCFWNPSRCAFLGAQGGFIACWSFSGSANVFTNAWDVHCPTFASDQSVFTNMGLGMSVRVGSNIYSRDPLFQNAKVSMDPGAIALWYKGALGIYDVPAGDYGMFPGNGTSFHVEGNLYGSGNDPTSKCFLAGSNQFIGFTGGFPPVWTGGVAWNYLGYDHPWTDIPFADPDRLFAIHNNA